jgi:hypothetical protein
MCGGGNRSPHGAQTQQIPASILRTLQRRGLDVTATRVTTQQTPKPVVLDALRSASLH